MVIDYFHTVCMVSAPDKTDSPLVVDSDAVLSLPVSSQGFQAVRGRNPEIIKAMGVIYDPEFAPCSLLNIMGQSAGKVTKPYLLGFF